MVQLVVMEEVRRQADHMEKNIPEAVGEAFPPRQGLRVRQVPSLICPIPQKKDGQSFWIIV